MDMWAESNANQSNENDEPTSGRYSSANRRYDTSDRASSRDYSNRGTLENGQSGKRGSKKNNVQEKVQKNEYDSRVRPNPNHRNKFSSGEENLSRNSGRRANEQTQSSRRDTSKRGKERQHEETEEDELDIEEEEDEEEEEEEEEEERYSSGVDYQKKYYEERIESQERNSRRGYRPVESNESKYENEKTSSSASSDSDDESTITVPETGRKVEHIAQKLEQTAQKYAREHSPPKFIERRNDYKSLERNREDKQGVRNSYDRYNGNERDRTRVGQRLERERGERYYDKSCGVSQKSSTYERERTFEKNPDRNRNIERASGRRFERPRPPSEEAPERPTDVRGSFFRERCYSDKEEAIYGETGRFARDPVSVEKERGYESNFETKLERNKVIERHGYQQMLGQNNFHRVERNGPSTLERNDDNNNTLKDDRRPLLPRQTTAVGHLIQTGRAFEVDAKSPKLVKRTKSFWRFRRDSDVLEGMALWQHRSLVDIPKMIKKESTEEKSSEDSLKKAQSSEGSPTSRQSLEKRDSDVTLTNEQCQEEPKPAERIHVPEKSDYFEDFPTPAERSKVIERSEYRTNLHQEERAYFVGNVSRKAIIEKERKRSLEAKRNMIVAELKENNEAKRNERRQKNSYGNETDNNNGMTSGRSFSETEASDEESSYSCIVVKDQTVAEKTLLPRTKLRRDSDRERDKNVCGPWYDLWGVDSSVNKKKKKKQQ